jgi:uncharacterized membrane protein YdjX (TVP38/TMEM64 family)
VVEKLLLVAALASGLAVAGVVYFVGHSKAAAGGLGVITAYFVFGELGDLVRPAGGAAERPEDEPLFANPRVRRRLLSLAALFVAAILVAAEFITGDLDVQDIREWIRDLGFWGPILLILVLAVAMVVAPIPNPPFMIAAGIAWGTTLGVTYAVIGQLIGSMIIFWLSRRFGRKLIPRLIGQAGADRVDRLATRMGPQLVFWWRMMPVSFDFAAYAAGLTTMSFRLFILLVFAGSILPTTVVVGFGDSFGKSWEAVAVTGLIILTSLAVLSTVLYRTFREELGPPREALRKLLGAES